jgi:hypothetical protein
MKDCAHVPEVGGDNLAQQPKALPSIEEIKQYLHYDPETGRVTWIRTHPMARGICIGNEAGGINLQGYRSFAFRGKHIRVHRFAFAYMHGRWPQPYCDHINGDRLDNRACNLRECDPSQNCQNRPAFKNNTAGAKGVSYDRDSRKWRSRVWVGGNVKFSRRFSHLEDAVAFVKQAREQLHGEFARH